MPFFTLGSKSNKTHHLAVFPPAKESGLAFYHYWIKATSQNFWRSSLWREFGRRLASLIRSQIQTANGQWSTEGGLAKEAGVGRKIGLSEGHNCLKMTGEKDGENIMFLSSGQAKRTGSARGGSHCFQPHHWSPFRSRAFQITGLFWWVFPVGGSMSSLIF